MIGYSFTPQLRAVLAMAREEARRFRHEFIGAEHILLALTRDEDGGSARVFRHLDVAPERIRQKLEETLVPGLDLSTGPDLPFTARGKKALELTLQETARFRAAAADTQHLLLGLCAEGKGIAAQVLAMSGVTIDRARAAVEQLDGVTPEPLPPAADAAADVVNVTIEIRRADGSVSRVTMPSVGAALEYLIDQP